MYMAKGLEISVQKLTIKHLVRYHTFIDTSEFGTMPTKRWFPIEVGDEIVSNAFTV